MNANIPRTTTFRTTYRHRARYPLLAASALALCHSADAEVANGAYNALAERAIALARDACPGAEKPRLEDPVQKEVSNWKHVIDCIDASIGMKQLQAARLAGDASTATTHIALVQEIQALQLAQSSSAEKLAEAQREQDFLGLSWGIGLGFGWSEDDRIEQADVVNGLIVARKDTSEQARVFYEWHWFPEQWQDDLLGLRDASGRIVRAHGPFVTVAARDDKVLSGVGFGWMVGFRDPSQSDAFTVAAGVMLDNDVTMLADGFNEGEPLPAGETQVRFKTESEASYILFFTRAF